MKSLFQRILPVVVVMSMILVSCSMPAASMNATPTAILAVSPTSTLPVRDDVWDRIMLNKKIVVGTSWDYPPFSSVDPNFKVVGFDIDLIKEIGRRLQIPIEIQNYAYEGLPGALQINQIDLAVAAMADTPERANQMSFSPIYFVSQTAILARNDPLVPNITDFNQLAGFRVGVRRGTTYEKMVQNSLVDTKLMGSDKLLSYTQTDESVRDLIQNRVDAVVLGDATANYYGSQQNLHVVGKGFQQQNLAVAMRLGAPHLKAEIDRVMGEMLTDGTILGFIQKYIQSDVTGILSTAIPSTPSAVTIPVAPATIDPLACVDGMKFIADVTFSDDNMKNPPLIPPGQGFIKTWRVQNTGTCMWTPNYRLVYAYGNVAAAQMGGQPINIPVNVAPGATIDLSVVLFAPLDPFTYQGFWLLQNEKGQLFGQAIWVAISTGASATTTPLATAPSNCVVTVIDPRDSVKVDSNFNAVWTVKNTSGQDWNADSVDYNYVSGTKMQKQDLYDLGNTIKNGESGKIIVNMLAPSQAGVYSTNWAIVSGNGTLCSLSMNVTVTK